MTLENGMPCCRERTPEEKTAWGGACWYLCPRSPEEVPARLLERVYPILKHYFGCPEAEKAFTKEVLDLVTDIEKYLEIE